MLDLGTQCRAHQRIAHGIVNRGEVHRAQSLLGGAITGVVTLGRFSRGENQGVGHFAHRARRHDDRVTLLGVAAYQLGNIFDAFAIADRRAAEFHHETHSNS